MGLKSGHALGCEGVVQRRGAKDPGLQALTERTITVAREPTPRELREQERNPWRRLHKHDHECDDRLALGAPTGGRYQHPFSHGDGARWTLESRLGNLLPGFRTPCARSRPARAGAGIARRRPAALLVCGRRAGPGAADRAASGDRSDRADSSAAAGRRHTRLLPGKPAPGPVKRLAADEAHRLEGAEAYAVRLDPLRGFLRTPAEPPVLSSFTEQGALLSQLQCLQELAPTLFHPALCGIIYSKSQHATRHRPQNQQRDGRPQSSPTLSGANGYVRKKSASAMRSGRTEVTDISPLFLSDSSSSFLVKPNPETT